MSRKIFVNLPVADLDKSVEFFTRLGFTFDPKFSDENATSMVVNGDSAVMLLKRDFFSTFTPRAICDTATHSETMIALSADSREEVDGLVEAALGAGGGPIGETQDHGFMYGRAFTDLDGHHWEVVWMDPKVLES
jgi:uncharacterized protein